jgi:threonine synthase
METSTFSLRHQLSQFLPSLSNAEILDFGLTETPLIETSNSFANYLGVVRCFLKLETELPTGTMKDRITELMFSRFKKERVTEYAHASTGNTAASLAWGMNQYTEPFEAHLFIAEQQLPYHNFVKPNGMQVSVLKEATYDESVRYATWYTKNILRDERELGGATSTFRHEASKLSYLEAFAQLCSKKISVDVVAQSISAGVGIIGADKAVKDALRREWLRECPHMVVAQPNHANPIVACYQNGAFAYDQKFSIKNPKKSLAWPIRRGDASGTYPLIRDILYRSSGYAFGASEKAIYEAKHALEQLEGIEAGYASSVVLAALHTKRHLNLFKDKTILVMVTGKDRKRDIVVHVNNWIPKKDWQPAISKK